MVMDTDDEHYDAYVYLKHFYSFRAIELEMATENNEVS